MTVCWSPSWATESWVCSTLTTQPTKPKQSGRSLHPTSVQLCQGNQSYFSSKLARVTSSTAELLWKRELKLTASPLLHFAFPLMLISWSLTQLYQVIFYTYNKYFIIIIIIIIYLTLIFFCRFLFMAQHNPRLLVHASSLYRIAWKWHPIWYSNSADFRISARCPGLRVKHSRQHDNASAKTNSLHYFNVDASPKIHSR